jgi:hypothetical protein
MDAADQPPDENAALVEIPGHMADMMEGLAERLQLDVEQILYAGLMVLDWYVSVDETDGQQVMIVDDHQNAWAPRLMYQTLDETGVGLWPLLPSERE